MALPTKSINILMPNRCLITFSKRDNNYPVGAFLTKLNLGPPISEPVGASRRRISTVVKRGSPKDGLGNNVTLISALHRALNFSLTCLLCNGSSPLKSIAPPFPNLRRRYSSAVPRHRVKEGEPRLKQDAQDIYFAGLEAVEPTRAVEDVLSRDGDVLRVGNEDYALSKNVYVAAFGKAVVGMVRALEDLIGDHIVEGVASIRAGTIDELKSNGLHSQIPSVDSKIALCQGSKGHFADEISNAASIQIYDLARRLQNGDILVVLISGGGSRLLSAPCPPITIEEQNVVTRLLYAHGATVADVNAMRRHTSLLKGGRLAQLASPARVIGLIMSDTPGDALELIGSGPTAPDPTTPRHCLDLIKAFGIESHFPRSILNVLRQRTAELERASIPPLARTWTSSYSAAEGYVIPTPIITTQNFSHVQNVVVANSKLLCVRAARMAEEIGYQTFILTSKLTGVASERGEEWGRLAAYASYMLKRKGSEPDRELVKLEMSLIENGMRKQTARDLGRVASAAFNSGSGMCIISAGSLTVDVPTSCSGVGGRSRELALSAAIELDALKRSCNSSLWYKDVEIAFLCMATDGVDGPDQQVAGVFVDDNTIQMATNQRLNPSEFMQNHDTHRFFQQLADGAAHLVTGFTGTSVGDFQILLIKSKHNNTLGNTTQQTSQ